jgi:putative component of toxin-antitoxin plasmid stabilization module
VVMILLCGGTKQTQSADIMAAKTIAKELGR